MPSPIPCSERKKKESPHRKKKTKKLNFIPLGETNLNYWSKGQDSIKNTVGRSAKLKFFLLDS